MTVEQARNEKAKIQIDRLAKALPARSWSELPVTFRRLNDASFRLMQRIECIDKSLLSNGSAVETRHNPVASQINRIADAFPETARS